MSIIELFAASPALYVGTTLVLGLAMGSFLNVVIYRLPIILERQWREQCAEVGASSPATPAAVMRFTLAVPRSACPTCHAQIRPLHNVPLISWVALGGRCASCGTPIPLRYPLVEGLTGLLSAAVAWRFGFEWAALGAMVLTWFLVALTFIDIDHQLLPDTLTLPLLWLGLLISLWGPHEPIATLPVDLRASVIGAMAGYASLWSVYHLFRLVTGKEGMGYGDFKLFAAIGAWLGWQMLFPTILLAAVTGTIGGLAMLGLRRGTRSTPIAFGPYLAASAWVVLMVGRGPLSRYFGFFAWPLSL